MASSGVATQAASQPRRRSAANRRASTTASAIVATKTARKPTSCTIPCRLMRSGAPAGAPTGNPAPASVTNTPAVTSPAPITASSRGAQIRPRPDVSRRRRPTEPAMNRAPQTTKLATWIQPNSPRLSRLMGWRRRSNPSRVNAWARLTAMNSGPATIAPASR